MPTTTNVHFLVIFLVFLIATSTSSCNARPIKEKAEGSVVRVSIPEKVEQSDQPYKYAGGEEEVYFEGRKYEVVESKVQQKKRSGEKKPEFHLDYAPSKTHPPSNN